MDKLSLEEKIKLIKEALLRSGYPLEIEISSILRKREYEVTPKSPFFDKDEQKTRELDIMAHVGKRSLFDRKTMEQSGWYLNPFLTIECKKSMVYSWVFFRSDPPAMTFDIGHSIDILTEKRGHYDSMCGEMLKNCASELLHYYSKHIVGSYEQVKLGGRDKGKDMILDAISKTTKFIDYTMNRLKRFFTFESIRKDIIFFFPLIVFDGELYEASFGKTLELKEAKHLIYETRYFPTLTRSLSPMYIDIVRKDYLDKALSLIENDISRINNYLADPKSQNELSKILEKNMKR